MNIVHILKDGKRLSSIAGCVISGETAQKLVQISERIERGKNEKGLNESA